MTSLPRALALAFGQLGDPAILKILFKTALITLAVFVAGGALLWAALDASIEGWIVANLPADYSDSVAGLVAIFVGVVAAWLLFRVVALFVLQFFAEDVVRAVEARHYPRAAETGREIPLAEETGNALRSLLRTVLANAAALPVAAVLLLTGVGAAAVFWAVNAYLIGRELRDMVWLRHRPGSDAPAPLGAGTRFLLGGVVVALLAIPFVNFLAPILGAASATHLVHRARERNPNA